MQGARYSDDKLYDYISQMEMTFDNGEWQLLDHGYQELTSLNGMWFPRPVEIRFRKDVSDGQPLDTCLGECYEFSASCAIAGIEQISLQHEGNWMIQDLFIRGSAGGALAGATAADMFLSGKYPHQNMYIPMYKYSDDDDFGIDTKKYGRIDVKTTTTTGANVLADLQSVAEYVVPTGE